MPIDRVVVLIGLADARQYGALPEQEQAQALEGGQAPDGKTILVKSGWMQAQEPFGQLRQGPGFAFPTRNILQCIELNGVAGKAFVQEESDRVNRFGVGLPYSLFFLFGARFQAKQHLGRFLTNRF